LIRIEVNPDPPTLVLDVSMGMLDKRIISILIFVIKQLRLSSRFFPMGIETTFGVFFYFNCLMEILKLKMGAAMFLIMCKSMLGPKSF
jgi:hypothetical protein